MNKELSSQGIPVYSANVFEPFGYINKTLIKDFSTSSIIWGIDGDWLVNVLPKDLEFYPTDHCGILRIKSDGVVEPKYLAWLLFNEGKKARFSRSYRASLDRISQISIMVPDYEIQKNIVSQVDLLECKIKELENKLNEINKQKTDILSKYLN